MDIGVPYRVLGPVDVTAASAWAKALPETAWTENTFRQEVLTGGAHAEDTRAVLLKYNFMPLDNPWRIGSLGELFVKWARHKGLDEATVAANRPEPEAEHQLGVVYVFPKWHELRPLLEPVVEQAVSYVRTPHGMITRVAVVAMTPGGKIAPHIDGQEMARQAHRIHVPLISPPGVEYKVDGRKFTMATGQAYDFNNRRQHSVRHGGKRLRVNILIDYLPDARPPRMGLASSPGVRV